MKREIIVTDLTRFNKKDLVCIAGIDPRNGELVRPMPYLTAEYCRAHNILPGTRLKAYFKKLPLDGTPHTEDYQYPENEIENVGAVKSTEFQQILDASKFESIQEGFEIELNEYQKHVPSGHKLERSIVTVEVSPWNLEIVADSFNKGKIKLHFRDSSSRRFAFIPITDLRFHEYALRHHDENELHEINDFIASQERVYLRIGLSRIWPEKKPLAYWMQANGIYTFPEFREDIRRYE